MRAQQAEDCKNKRTRSRDGKGRTNSFAVAFAAALLAGGIMLVAVDTSRAQALNQQAGPFPAMSTFQAGKITSVHGTTVQIDGRDYELRPDVEIKKPDGNDMEVQDIRRSALAQFHLKQGKIDKLVVILPE